MGFRGPGLRASTAKVVFGVAVVAAVVWGAVVPRVVVPELLPDLSGPPISYDHLASEATDPHPFSDKTRVSDDWHRAIADHRDVRDCLVPDQRGLDRPDLRRFDWAGVRGLDRDVCLFRVFSSLGSPERVLDWLEVQGFDPWGPSVVARGEARDLLVGGGYSPRDDGVFLPGGTRFGRWIWSHVIYGETIGATWGQDGALRAAWFSSSAL